MGEVQPIPDVELRMLSQPRLLTAARAMVYNLAQRHGFSDLHAGQVSLAVDEALCNVINHGYQRAPHGMIEIRLWALETDPPSIKVVVEDRAAQVEPDSIRSRDLDDIRPGGLGVHIIREIMDDVRYEKRPGGGMRLTMTKANPDDSEGTEGCDGHSAGTGKVARDG